MGIWDPYSFEYDHAMEKLAGWLVKIVETIKEVFTHETHDERYRNGLTLLVSIDILATLINQYESYPDVFMQLEDVSRWKKDYLETYDHMQAIFAEQESYTQNDGFTEVTREDIAAIFDRLYNAVKKVNDLYYDHLED